MRAVQITQFGGPEVLKVVDVEPPTVRDDLVLIDVDSAGVNYADTHQTEDSYLAPQKLPLVPGGEVVGRVRGGALDGRRVVALTLSGGGYAAQALAHPNAVFPLPDDITDGQALALVLQGTTAWHLLRTCGRLCLGETIVVHAAAGGVGTLAVQLARQWGAGRVIATASSAKKRQLALDLGADVAVDVSAAGTADEVRDLLKEAAGGRGVDIVLEMTGGHVFDGSLAALRPWGRLIVYGMASRTAASPVAPAALMAGTRSVSGFWLVHALQLPGGLGPAMEELLSLVRAGQLKPVVGGSYPLSEAARAHQDLLSRGTTGKLVLTVGPGA
ncbi:MAG TPA: NADPH:quinone oxidoreductase family protein [Kineosporiaceae bacterium]